MPAAGVPDPGLLARLKAACARLESPVAQGTGYLVGTRRIATCEHVVHNLPPGTPVTARFGDDADAPLLPATVVESRAASDSAILEIENPPAGVDPLPLGARPLPHPGWAAYGFPAFADGLGVAMTGVVMDQNSQIPGGMRGMAVFSEMLGAHPPQSVGGLSGSPVLVDGRVVGHLSSVLGAQGAMQQPHLGQAYVALSPGVAELLGTPVDDTPPAQLPTPESQILSLSVVFHALQFSASSDEVNRILAQAASDGTLTPEVRVYAAEVLIGLVLPEQALKTLKDVPGPRAEELRALALSLQGDHAGALAGARALRASAEARGIEGGILKRRWLATRNQAFLRSAFAVYFEAYTAYRDHYPGINAAACALYLGRRDESARIATEIVAALAPKRDRNNWEEASLAEAYLLTGALDKAKTRYRAAVDARPEKTREIAVMRSQARRDLKSLGRPTDELGDAFPPARRAAVFASSAVATNLSAQRIPVVRGRIDEILDENGIQFGFCSATSRSDLIFLDALLDRGGEARVFLPYPRADVLRLCVGDDPAWRHHFDRTMARVGVDRTAERPSASAADAAVLYANCNDDMQEAARKQAGLLAEPPLLVALSREQDEPDLGGKGTALAVQSWLERGEREIVRIEPLE